MDVPVMYRCNNLATASYSPAGVHTRDNATERFYARYLMKRAISAIKLDLPDEWARNYVEYTIFARGFGAVLEIPRYGVIFQGGNLYGRNVYYQPTRFITANPLFQTPSDGWAIHKDCVLVQLQPDYSGLVDVVETYASRLALAYEAWQMNTQNSKLAYIIGAGGSAQAKTFEALFDKIQSGVPAVAAGNGVFGKDGKPLWTTFSNDLKQNYVAPVISQDMRSIMNEFDSFVGIPSNPANGKKERQIVDEVNANNIETDTLLDLFVESLSVGFDEANEKYGLSLRASKKYDVIGGVDNGRKSVNPGTV